MESNKTKENAFLGRVKWLSALFLQPSQWLVPCSVVLLFGMIVAFMALLRNNHDPIRIFDNLVDSREVIVLKNWTPRYMAVDAANVPRVADTSLPAIALPDKEATTRIVNERAANTDIVMSYDLGADELAWLESQARPSQTGPARQSESDVEFIAPRMQMSRATLQFQNTFAATRTGSGNFLLASLDIEDLRKNPQLILIFKITNTPWFGPTQFPIVLARPSASQKILNLEQLATTGELYTDLMTLGFALMLIAFSRVANHAPSVTWLAVYCGARGLRVFVGYLINAHLFSQHIEVSLLAPVHFGLDMATALALTATVARQVNLEIPFKLLGVLGALFYAAYALLTNSFFSPSWVNTSTWAGDAYSGVVCVILLFMGALSSLRHRRAGEGFAAGSAQGQAPLRREVPLGLILTFAAVVLLTWGAFEHLLDIFQGRAHGILSLKISVVLPLLILSVLWNVNSVTLELDRFGEEMKKRFSLLIASVSRINNAMSVREILGHLRQYLKDQVFKETGTDNEVVLNSWAMGQDGTRSHIETTLTNALRVPNHATEVRAAGGSQGFSEAQAMGETESLFTGIADPSPHSTPSQDLLSEDQKGLNLRVQSGDQVRGYIHVTGLSRGMLSSHTQMGVAAVLSSVGNAIDKFHTFNGMRILANVELLAFLGLRHASEIRTGLSQSHNLVAVFLDMAGFTAASGRMSGKDLATFTNRFLQEPTRIVQAHQGYIDKYMGDGLFALFKEKSQALAALPKLLAAAQAFNKEQEKVESDKVSIRIGANYGEVIVTAQGIEGKRIELTGLSESVNLASRMESGNKALGSLVLANEGLFEGTREALRVHGGRRLGEVLFVGASTSVAVLELHVSPHKMLPSSFNDFEEAVEMFTHGNLQRAAELFARLKSAHPGDKILDMYINQIASVSSGLFAQPEFAHVLVLQSK